LKKFRVCDGAVTVSANKVRLPPEALRGFPDSLPRDHSVHTAGVHQHHAVLRRGGLCRTLAYAGTFYLPNRLHARPEQVRAAYPELEVFIARKRNYDPQLRFRNLMWDKYFFD
jgi:hypothetical protein